MNAFSLRSASVLLLTAALAACDGSGTSIIIGNPSARLTLNLTDAPVDNVQAVNIEVTGVMLQPLSGSVENIVYNTPKPINLLDLQNGVRLNLLDERALPSGEYSWMRLQVNFNKARVVDSNGAEHVLTIPSGENTGLKVNTPFLLSAGNTLELTLDFDVRKSLVRTGNGQYLLKPVLRLVEDSQAGTLRGAVDAATLVQIDSLCRDRPQGYLGAVYVYEGADRMPGDMGSNAAPLVAVPVRTDASETLYGYAYRADWLPAGRYTLAWTCDIDNPELAEGLTFLRAGNVTVNAGRESRLDIVAP